MRTRRLVSDRWFFPRVWLTPAVGVALCTAWLLADGLCAAPALAQSAKPARELIAVLELDAVEASKSEAAALTDRLREELLRTGAVTLVDRGQLDAVLNEQALQQAGCTTQECAVQVGRILGVRKIVAGRVNKVSTQIWLVSASVIDVETAETLRSESKQFRGDFFDLMGAGMTQLAQQLLPPPVAAVRPAVPPAAPVPPLPPNRRRPARPRPTVGRSPGCSWVADC